MLQGVDKSPAAFSMAYVQPVGENPRKRVEDRVLVSVENLRTYFNNNEGLLKAVDDVSFVIREGESLGVVGESGCGKSVTAQSIMNLLPKQNAVIAGGHVHFSTEDGQTVETTSLDSDSKIMRSIRGNEIAMIFQEPMTSLSPVYTIGSQIAETLIHHRKAANKKDAKAKAIHLLDRVGISAPRQRVDAYPFELSGGMRQRAMIAMALSCNPRLLIADEPTTALDVTVEAQILDLIKDLQREYGMALMIITHDLGVIGETADRVIVMYMGMIVEHGSVDDIFYDTRHPYTKGLLKSLPVIGRKRRLTPIGGSVPNPYFLPEGCAFSPRCTEAHHRCQKVDAGLVEVSKGHFVRCSSFSYSIAREREP
jgi:oligopeptide/dipeptide ABC transporter ATP-binding protein